MKRLTLLFLIFSVLTGIDALAQNVSVKFGATKLLYDKKYFPTLYGEGVAPVIPSIGAKVGWRDMSSSPYAAICKRPEFGLAIQVDGLADAPALNGPGMGNIYSIYGYFDRNFLEYKGFSLGYSAGYGLGLSFSKLYDPVTNPWNRLLSVPVNSHITFGIQAKIALSRRYDAGIGFYFNHNSNGAVKFPNRGYNGFELSLSLGMKSIRDEAPIPETTDDGFRRKFQFDIQFSGGMMSNEAYFDYCLENKGGGDNMYYFKYAFTADCIYRYCRTHATGIGVDVFVTPFCKHIAEYDGRGIDYKPVSFGISIKHQMRYRNLSLTAGLGRYLYDNDGIARNKKLYQMVIIKYHFPTLYNTYAGIVLKAHKFMAAESIQICIGKSF